MLILIIYIYTDAKLIKTGIARTDIALNNDFAPGLILAIATRFALVI
jgi:hypothetical protein